MIPLDLIVAAAELLHLLIVTLESDVIVLLLAVCDDNSDTVAFYISSGLLQCGLMRVLSYPVEGGFIALVFYTWIRDSSFAVIVWCHSDIV